jgi:tRNA G46 methylase TrmB
VVRNEVIALLGPHVKEGGHLHIATDVRDYAAWAGSVMEQHTGEWEAEDDAAGHGSAVATLLPSQVGPQEGAEGRREEPLQAFGLLPERPVWRPVTHYERRGIEELGHDIYDLCYRRRPHTQAS